jgi:hypothetical protein
LFVVESSSHIVLKVPAKLCSRPLADLVRHKAEGTSRAAPRKLQFVRGRRLEGELIPQTVHCSEVYRMPWIVLQLLPEFHNVDIHTSSAVIALSEDAASLRLSFFPFS